MAEKFNVLVYGASGAQGRSIVQHALAGGLTVRGIGRSGRAVVPGAEFNEVDLDDASGLAAAHEGVNSVIFMLPLVFDVEQAVRWTGNALRAAERAGVQSFVFDTSAPVPDSECGVAAVDLKVKAERLVNDADLPVTIIRPTIYLGNLLAPWAAPAIVRDGVLAYPLPAEARVAWTSWENAAIAVVAAARRPDLVGRVFDLGGPEALDGSALAAAVGAGLNRAIDYVPVPLEGFEAGLSQAMGPEIGREITALYRWFAGEGRPLLDRTGTSAAQALGVALTDARSWSLHQDWVRHAAPEPATA